MSTGDTPTPQAAAGGRTLTDKQTEASPLQTRGAVLVLIAEDEEPIAEALAIMVEEAGYRAILARHGREALELAREHPPALVITDLMMPYLDGASLIQAIRDDAAAKGLSAPPIILMTAASGRRAEEARPDVLLSKPFDLDEVETLLSRFLGAE